MGPSTHGSRAIRFAVNHRHGVAPRVRDVYLVRLWIHRYGLRTRPGADGGRAIRCAVNHRHGVSEIRDVYLVRHRIHRHGLRIAPDVDGGRAIRCAVNHRHGVATRVRDVYFVRHRIHGHVVRVDSDAHGGGHGIRERGRTGQYECKHCKQHWPQYPSWGNCWDAASRSIPNAGYDHHDSNTDAQYPRTCDAFHAQSPFHSIQS